MRRPSRQGVLSENGGEANPAEGEFSKIGSFGCGLKEANLLVVAEGSEEGSVAIIVRAG